MKKKRSDQRKYHFIYKTTCVITNKFYVGMHSTDDIDDGYLGSGIWLGRSIKKHGRDVHKREILETLLNREALRRREAEIVDKKLIEEKLCMNMSTGGRCRPAGKNSGPFSEEHRKKLSEARLKWFREVGYSKETKQKMSKTHTGMKMSEAAKKNMSVAKEGVPIPALQGRKAWNKGKTGVQKHTEETKKKMSAARLGKKMPPRSDEYRKKQSESHKGKKHTLEARKNMGDARRGKKHSEAARKKMSIAAKRRETKKRLNKNELVDTPVTKHENSYYSWSDRRDLLGPEFVR